MDKRYTFRQDNDCHWYLLTVVQSRLFDELIDEENYEDERWAEIEECRCSSPSNIIFESPSIA